MNMRIWETKALSTILMMLLAALALVNIVGYFLNNRYLSMPAAIEQANDYEVRSLLLMEAIYRVGACDPKEAARLWADGLQGRSAALQYAAMDARLKVEYARQLEETNWVTGMSSPWVESYYIDQTECPDEDSRIVRLIFNTATSTGPAGTYAAALHLMRDGCYWRIADISADAGLYPYMGFEP